MTPNQYCENKVRQSGSSFYYSILFLSERQRAAITVLYAFYCEVNTIAEECSEAQIAHNKLQWWTEEIYVTFNGDQHHQANHPICLALKPLIQQYSLKIEYFLDIIRGIEMKLYHQNFQSFSDLETYCYHTAGAMRVLASEIMGYQNPETLKHAKFLGTALQLTTILRHIKNDLALSRLYLPMDEMQQFGVTEEMLKNEENGPQIRQLFIFQSERAESYFQKSLSLLPETDRYSQRSGLIMAYIYLAVLKKIKKQNYPVLRKRVTINPFHKLWLAWNTARKEYKHSLSNY